ncbi:MAG: bi-domain-containing oxidoreductase [Bacteroidia bacterium]
MEQLTQNLKDGKMELLEVPFPALTEGNMLVRVHFSVISAGTEGKTVKDARLGYIGKARSRQEEVKKVIQVAKTQGVMKTYQMVMNKLEAPSALGYSCAGEVIAVAPDVRGFKVGDHVACAGAGAVHSEVVSVPKNLCVKVGDGVRLDHAAFSTIAAIALQGIRQADLRLGENCVVIGLGLVGQLTVQMLNAAGVDSIGIDIDPRQVKLAQETGARLALERNAPGLEDAIMEQTGGHGADSVIITAGTSSLDPVELAGTLCRTKGKVVIVGVVPTGFSRKNFYRKELDLRMSCSYGPGRYDANYEEKGIDYPIGYVRWTENRNMQAFLHMLQDGKIDMEKLITHEYKFFDAPNAYQMILDKKEPFVGVVLKYDTEKELTQSVKVSKATVYAKADANLGFIGAGSFGQNFLLPNVKGKANLVGVATARSNSARNIADKYGFSYCPADADELVKDENINTLFIATRHNTHAEYVMKGLQNNKNVFVEKPLCMTEEELEEIRQLYDKSNARLMVGFNRRFAPHIKTIKQKFSDQLPKAINYRINSGKLPDDHWIQDPEIGGGRIVGEACHFIDLAMYIAGSPITSVSANGLRDAKNHLDTVTISLGFENGSVAAISYFSNGSKSVQKEYLEVFCGGMTAIVDDFKNMTLHGNKVSKDNLSSQDKGHAQELHEFLQSIKEGKPAPIPFEDVYLSTLATFKVLESIREQRKVILADEANQNVVASENGVLQD